jgi:hypothetical protein
LSEATRPALGGLFTTLSWHVELSAKELEVGRDLPSLPLKSMPKFSVIVRSGPLLGLRMITRHVQNSKGMWIAAHTIAHYRRHLLLSNTLRIDTAPPTKLLVVMDAYGLETRASRRGSGLSRRRESLQGGTKASNASSSDRCCET